MPQRWAGAWPAKASAYGGPTGRTVCPETGEAGSHVLDLAFSRGCCQPRGGAAQCDRNQQYTRFGPPRIARIAMLWI